MSSGKKTSSVVQSPARDYDSDASSALDEEDRSDGESLDGDEVYQREVVARIYRPATLSDPSAYSVDIARQYSRPALNEKPVSKAVDFAAYTKAAAQAELLRATQKDAPPIKSHEFVSDDMKRMYADAFTRPSSAAKTPAIDFNNVKPTASDVMSTYDYSSWGGVASHHSARYSQARYDGPQMPPDLQVRADRADKSEAKRRATTQGLQSNAPEPVEEPAVDHKELARKAERARVEHEIVETNDVERKDFLRMLLSLQSDVDREQQEKRDQQQQAAVAPPTTEEKPVSVKPAHVDPVMAPVFDFAAASVLANRVNHDDEAEEIRNATRRFYTAVAIIEDLVTGDELTGLVRQLLERYRRQFQASKALRERGEYSHADHEAFRHFATIVEDYIFSRVAREVGPDFDVEEFFEKVFEEEDDAEERATVARSEDSARDRLTQRAASYPVLSSDAWELLLAIMNFESFTDLMDHFIFTYNKSAVSQHQSATSTSQQSFQPSLSSAAPDAPTRAKPAAVPTKTAPKPPAPARR